MRRAASMIAPRWVRRFRPNFVKNSAASFGCGTDQPRAELGKLAAELRFDAVAQYRRSAILLQPHRCTALGKSGNASSPSPLI
jgi:hypothetical protein